jgi:murein DD-endopeptidase MepM/ murein hydrolase activator NlpD
MWSFPLKNYNGIPVNPHPGAFAFKRRKNYHTGIDLYTNDQEPVFAVESGTITNIDYFTGPKLSHLYWEETLSVMIEGETGTVNYGEIIPHESLEVGNKIKKGQIVGKVKRVLFPDKIRNDIPGHSTSMLHLELYPHNQIEFLDWELDQDNPGILDPTPHLLSASPKPKNILIWNNKDNKSVG